MADLDKTSRWIQWFRGKGIPAVAVDCKSGRGLNGFIPAVQEVQMCIRDSNYDGHYDMWQFASDGKVPGITGNVDLNVYYTNKVVQRYFVTYNANGGTNAPVDTTAYEKGSSILLKGQENMKREGYSFTGWNTKADGSGTVSYTHLDVYKRQINDGCSGLICIIL